MSSRRIVGLVPAAGRAARLPGLPCSKEIVPVGTDAAGRPLPVAAHLLHSFRSAGIARAIVVTRSDKRDLAIVLGDGRRYGLELSWITVDDSPSLPHTLDRVHGLVAGARIALGLPDCIVRPQDLFVTLIERERREHADVVLAVVPTDRPDKADVVEHDAAGRVRTIAIKQPGRRRGDAWIAALWSTEFTRYLHSFVVGSTRPVAREPHLGEVFLAAIDDGLTVVAQPFPDGALLDIGTPEDLARADEWLRGAAGEGRA